MVNRERHLLVALVGVAVIWGGWQAVDSWFLTPIRDAQAKYDDLESKTSQQSDDLVANARTRKQFQDWMALSLPPDPASSRRKVGAEALVATRLYQSWVQDIAELCKLQDFRIVNVRTSSKQKVYVAITVAWEAHGHYEQLCQFLDIINRTALLQRIGKLNIDSPESLGNPLLKITADCEGLVMLEAPERQNLFPLTALSAELGPEATELTVSNAVGFPKKPGFLIRLGKEFCEVTAINGDRWTIRRGAERTEPLKHSAQQLVQLHPIRTDQPAYSSDEWKTLVSQAIFLKPVPPVQYQPKFASPGEKIAVRGKPLEFTLALTGTNPQQGKPEFVLTGTPPATCRQ